MQLIELQYLPPIYSIITLFKGTDIAFPLYLPFRKMSFINRMVIPAANGNTTLSVPLVGGRENRELLKDVRIDNSQGWQVRHWRTITSAYRRSPWFEHYEPGLAPFFETRYEKLADWNLDLMGWVFHALKHKNEVTILNERPEAVPELLDRLRPSNFQDAVFVKGLPVYGQVFQDRIGFQPNMSIIDLIFNEGNNSRSFIANAFI
jgi:WbqC-like protein family